MPEYRTGGSYTITFRSGGGLAGLSALVQSLVLSTSAANSTYATNDAVELRLQ